MVLPVALHADHNPTALSLLRPLAGRRKCRRWSPVAASRAIGVLALRVVVVDEHHQPRTIHPILASIASAGGSCEPPAVKVVPVSC